MLKSLNSNACIFKTVKEHRSEVRRVFLYVEASWHYCRPSWKFRWGYLPTLIPAKISGVLFVV